MKKVLLLVVIILLISFININNNIKNIECKLDNIELYYPSFNNKNIDNYINNYLNNIIQAANYKFNNDYNMYIDYDYVILDNIIKLEFYQNIDSNNIEIKKVNTFDINTKSNKITKSNSNIEYDIYQNKFINKDKKMIAFTFDDGPNHNTTKIINTLNKYNATATFFVLGSRVVKNKNIIKLMDELGMEIGNHTYSHRLLTTASSKEIKLELDKTNELIYNITNTYPRLVRTSYGTFNNKIRKSINKPIIIWNIDTLDWKYHSANKIANKILNSVEDGDIILMHDIYTATANAIEIVVPKLIDKGYQIVSVSQLFYYKNIELKNGVVYSNAR